MPLGPLEENTPYRGLVARLIYHAGVSVSMDYGYKASAANSRDVSGALRDYFRYQADEEMVSEEDFSSSEWSTMLIQHLRQGFPVLFRGESSVGHTFLLTGFDTDGSTYFYMNFGWDGDKNGWYEIDNIVPKGVHYNDEQRALLYVKPDSDEYRDRYEGDDTSDKASYLAVSANGHAHSQAGHSIDPADDVDWITTYNDEVGTVTIEITNGTGDTRMWLYNAQGEQLAYDNDSGSGQLSKITRYLSRGRYFIKIDENGNNATIPRYDVTISR